MCGDHLPLPKETGRRAVYCSPACRKAAFDARRARMPGAFEVKVIDHEHDLRECVRRVLRSSTAVAAVFDGLADGQRLSKLQHSSAWHRAHHAMAVFLEAFVAAGGQRR